MSNKPLSIVVHSQVPAVASAKVQGLGSRARDLCKINYVPASTFGDAELKAIDGRTIERVQSIEGSSVFAPFKAATRGRFVSRIVREFICDKLREIMSGKAIAFECQVVSTLGMKRKAESLFLTFCLSMAIAIVSMLPTGMLCCFSISRFSVSQSDIWKCLQS